MKAIVCVGIPASGKSGFAECLVNEQDWVELNREIMLGLRFIMKVFVTGLSISSQKRMKQK